MCVSLSMHTRTATNLHREVVVVEFTETVE